MKLLVDSHSPLAAGTVSIRCPSYGRQGTVEGIADSSKVQSSMRQRPRDAAAQLTLVRDYAYMVVRC